MLIHFIKIPNLFVIRPHAFQQQKVKRWKSKHRTNLCQTKSHEKKIKRPVVSVAFDYYRSQRIDHNRIKSNSKQTKNVKQEKNGKSYLVILFYRLYLFYLWLFCASRNVFARFFCSVFPFLPEKSYVLFLFKLKSKINVEENN